MRLSNPKKSFAKAFILSTLFATIFATAAKAGGDVYEVYLNNKLVFKQFVIEPFNLKNLDLSKASPNDNLVINYSHCGTVGKERSIAIKDEKGTTLKEWKFADATGTNKGMTIPVKDILLLQKKTNTNSLTIFYAAQEMPKGRSLAVLNKAVKSIAS